MESSMTNATFGIRHTALMAKPSRTRVRIVATMTQPRWGWNVDFRVADSLGSQEATQGCETKRRWRKDVPPRLLDSFLLPTGAGMKT